MQEAKRERVRCTFCGCVVSDERTNCPFCGSRLPLTNRPPTITYPQPASYQNPAQSAQSIMRPQLSNSERRLVRELQRAATQRLLIIVLLSGIFAMDLLSLIVTLLK